jgi:hypothetical protein
MEQKALRLAELRAKQQLSDAEFDELISLSPPGMFIRMPDISVAGLHDLEQALKNLLEVNERIRKAVVAGFYLEAIALRAQFIELILRLFLGELQKETTPLKPEDRLPLGNLITQAEQKGLDGATVERLRKFNRDRIVAIHRYMLGAAPYEGFEPIFKESEGLVPILVKAVANKVGKKMGP